jgi:hypothetical protein
MALAATVGRQVPLADRTNAPAAKRRSSKKLIPVLALNDVGEAAHTVKLVKKPLPPVLPGALPEDRVRHIFFVKFTIPLPRPFQLESCLLSLARKVDPSLIERSPVKRTTSSSRQRGAGRASASGQPCSTMQCALSCFAPFL